MFKGKGNTWKNKYLVNEKCLIIGEKNLTIQIIPIGSWRENFVWSSEYIKWTRVEK